MGVRKPFPHLYLRRRVVSPARKVRKNHQSGWHPLSVSLLGHLIYGFSLGLLIPYVVSEKTVTGESEIAVIDGFVDALEVPPGEEETVKLPPPLLTRPIWEHKTSTLPLEIR